MHQNVVNKVLWGKKGMQKIGGKGSFYSMNDYGPNHVP